MRVKDIAAFFKFLHGIAARALVVRMGIVGLNFAVMMGLAWLLGIDLFGQLIVIWGLALIGSSILSVGAPLMLLRALSDGGRMTVGAVVCHLFLYPIALAAVGWVVLPLIFPALPWLPILAVAFGIHLITCLTSIMRSLGSVDWSMALRDAGPLLALGLAALIWAENSATIMIAAAFILAVFAGTAVCFCLVHPDRNTLIRTDGPREPIAMSMWGTSLLGMLLAQVDIVVGGAFLSDEQIGLYALLRRLTNLVVLPVSVATWVSSVPIAKAFGGEDRIGLIRAAARANQIAVFPGLLLMGCAICALIVAQWFAIGPEGTTVCLVLLAGALVQLGLAATFTVATLCDLAFFAGLARLSSLVIYLLLVMSVPVITPTINAVAYVTAISVGSWILWSVVRHKHGIDTSILPVVINRWGGSWKQS